MPWASGKVAILSEKDKKYVDLLMSGNNKYDAYELVYPDKCKGRNKKQIAKSIRDLLNKPKVKEYKESLEEKVDNALNEAIQSTAKSIANKRIAEEGDLLAFWTETMLDEDQSMQSRLKASEQLGKYYGMDKKSLDVNADINQQIVFVDEFDSEEESSEE